MESGLRAAYDEGDLAEAVAVAEHGDLVAGDLVAAVTHEAHGDAARREEEHLVRDVALLHDHLRRHATEARKHTRVDGRESKLDTACRLEILS